MQKIVTIIHGSHLYGLNTALSDIDFKSIYLPTLQDVLLERVKPNLNLDTKEVKGAKNTADDVDHTVYSLVSFVEQLKKGEMVAMDMIHAPRDLIKFDDPKLASLFFMLQEHRDMFYSKSMRSFMGYVKKQAAKYGIKGSRVATLRKLLDILSILTYSQKQQTLSTIIHLLPEDEFSIRKDNTFELMGKVHQGTVSIAHFEERVQKAFDGYGVRAIQAETNEGVDFKAISHAFRAGYQLLDMFEKGEMVLPFTGERNQFLRDVKAGRLDYVNVLQPQLEALMDQVNAAALASNLPDEIDHYYVDNFVYNMLKAQYMER